MVVRHPDQRDEVGTRWQRIVDETAPCYRDTGAEAEVSQAAPSSFSDGWQIEQSQLQIGTGRRDAFQKAALAAAHIQQAAMPVEAIGI